VPLRGERLTTLADFTVASGDRIPFVLTWHPSHEPIPPPLDPYALLEETVAWWEAWSARCTVTGPWREAVVRSLITLEALTYEPTGGIVAAATTSLPEKVGGVRNWDYRYCWLRDATLTLHSLMAAGYDQEARAWREWLLRAVAGDPSELQIMYGPAGERRLTERELDWLPGFEGSSPVRVGNAAAGQFQLDVYGEVMDALHQARCIGIEPEGSAWALQRALLDFLESNWDRADEGIWEVRGPRRHFTHSRVMAWVAMDRAVKAVERFGLDGPFDRWRRLRSTIHEDVCRRGYDAGRGAFTQSYGSPQLDASVLLIPQVGFLPPSDPRVSSTIDAIERELCQDGLVMRYQSADGADGLPAGEGAFLAATFWLVDALALVGRHNDADATFERLMALRNDVGLLAEEYDPVAGRQLGNFPQAFSHVALVNSALTLAGTGVARTAASADR
jgi:GH15 family glucan-1,4-alpha-glucosidase